jgi:hypothetical protein
VAVVPVLDGCTVSVDGMDSADLRLQANAATDRTTSRATKRSFFISKQQSGSARMSLARVVIGFPSEVLSCPK